MTGRDFIIVNGVSSHELGLYVDTPPMPVMSTPMFQTLNIPGRVDALTIKDRAREDIPVPISAYLFDDNAHDPNELFKYLSNAKTLITSKNANFYYKVRRLETLTPEYQGHGKQHLNIVFICEGLRYAVDNDTISSWSQEFTVLVNGTEFCQPVYKLFGNGTIQLTVNDDVENALTIYDVDGYVVADGEKIICHKDGQFVKSKGQIPFFAVGVNKVQTNASVIEITKNERWI